MKQILLSTLVVLGLISFNSINSMAFAVEKTTIYKVTHVSPANKLKLRAWPSTKSRIKVAIPHNAKDLTETGKQKKVGKSKWLEVNWKKNRGWVNGRYLKKTGVLLRKPKQSKRKVAASRNNKARSPVKSSRRTSRRNKTIIAPVESLDDKPQEYGGDRYDQPNKISSSDLKTPVRINNKNKQQKLLLCDGNSPKYWNIKMDVGGKNMRVNLANSNKFLVPIKYHNWATSNKIRMNIGGNKGRNAVDVNLEKTDACNNGLTRTNFTYEVNATINKNSFSGCCEVVTK